MGRTRKTQGDVPARSSVRIEDELLEKLKEVAERWTEKQEPGMPRLNHLDVLRTACWRLVGQELGD